MKTIDTEILNIFKTLDTPTVCNAIEVLNVRPRTQGFLPPSIRAIMPELPPMAGYAVTLTCRSRSKPTGTTAYGDLGRHMEAIFAVPKPCVLVIQDLDEEPLGASIGEMVGSLYAACGCVGMVTNGTVRDTPALRRRKLPLFASGCCCSHAYAQHLEMNLSVEIGGVHINPGDLIHGDADGVTTIPIDLATEVALFGKKLLEAEQMFFKYVDSGNVTIEGVSKIHAKVNFFHIEALEVIRCEQALRNSTSDQPQTAKGK